MNVGIKFEPASDILEEYLKDRSPFSAIKGPLGSSKTQTTIMKFLTMMQEQTPNAQGVRPTRLLIIRNTYPDLITTTLRDWKAITRDIAPVKMSHPPEQLIRYTLPDRTMVECDVIFIALDREEHVRKLRGIQATFAWPNEMKELPYAVIEMLDARLGRYPSRALCGVDCDHAGIISGDTNAPDEDHWYAKREQDPPDGWKFFEQPGAVIKRGMEWVLNPNAENMENLPEGYYQKLLQGKREDWIKVNLANQYGTAIDGKPIYEEFNSSIHVKEFDVNPDLPILFGNDFGLTPACVMAQEDLGQLRIFDEIVTENFSADEMADAMIRRRTTSWPELRWAHGWCDPANPRSQADKQTPKMVLQGKGFNVIPAPSNDFTLRRDAVGKRLKSLTMEGEPALIIHPRCKVLVKGMSGYYMFKRMKVAGDEAYHDVPAKNMYSHICEAAQYISLGIGDADTLFGYGNPKENWDETINRVKMSRRRKRNV